MSFFLSLRFLFVTFVLIFPVSVFAEDVKDQAEKIVMMLNIVNKEYHEGIRDGKIINEDEYGESQVFLSQSEERYQGIASEGKNKSIEKKINVQFKNLESLIESKKNPQEIDQAVKQLKTNLTKQFELKIFKTPRTPVSLAKGKAIYTKNCIGCHGPTGQGDGPKAKELDPRPARLADPQLTGDGITDPYDNFQIISVGIANTAMQAWSDTLSERDRWDVTYFVRTFSNKKVKLPDFQKMAGKAESDEPSNSPEKVIEEIGILLDKSKTAYQDNNPRAARLAVIDAYLVFEPIERVLIEKDRKTGKGIESTFGHLQSQMKKKAPQKEIEATIAKINLELKNALPLLK